MVIYTQNGDLINFNYVKEIRMISDQPNVDFDSLGQELPEQDYTLIAVCEHGEIKPLFCGLESECNAAFRKVRISLAHDVAICYLQDSDEAELTHGE